ncbi:Helicase C-terminal [Penicillium verhagenii]|uniref:Helicase C-terminal n=1 Tax=Penicillium verhagenii TaxID=1562060 RepID=UPI002545759F|nr:Helicase C-terminal [Penicillium verhagenii]KAJ5947142.1 Helicase C-terminal [Penicillium verhagenii]
MPASFLNISPEDNPSPTVPMTANRAPHGAGKISRRNSLEGYHSINFTAESMRDLDGSAARLAGAIGLDTCHQLHQLFSSACPATQDVIANFVKDRQNDDDNLIYIWFINICQSQV